MSKYTIHADFKKLEKNRLPLYPVLLPLLSKLMDKSNERFSFPDNIAVSKQQIQGYRQGSVKLWVIQPKAIEQNAPCLIYFHGGAFALKAAPYHIQLACHYALHTPCKVVFVDYRLAPKFPFPVAIEDGYAALEWVHRQSEALGIDRHKIAIGGDSAGGALAAGITQLARDRGAYSINFQMLVYPVTDARQGTPSMQLYTDTPMWNAKLNAKMWKIYLQDEESMLRQYASPMEAASLANLPDAYIEVAEFDCLRDEGILYAQALKQAGAAVELHQTTGTIHGYDMAEESPIVQQSKLRRINALQQAFYGGSCSEPKQRKQP